MLTLRLKKKNNSVHYLFVLCFVDYPALHFNNSDSSMDELVRRPTTRRSPPRKG